MVGIKNTKLCILPLMIIFLSSNLEYGFPNFPPARASDMVTTNALTPSYSIIVNQTLAGSSGATWKFLGIDDNGIIFVVMGKSTGITIDTNGTQKTTSNINSTRSSSGFSQMSANSIFKSIDYNSLERKFVTKESTHAVTIPINIAHAFAHNGAIRELTSQNGKYLAIVGTDHTTNAIRVQVWETI